MFNCSELERKVRQILRNFTGNWRNCAVFHGQIAEQSRMERGPIRTANEEHRGERGDLGDGERLAAPAAPLRPVLTPANKMPFAGDPDLKPGA